MIRLWTSLRIWFTRWMGDPVLIPKIGITAWLGGLLPSRCRKTSTAMKKNTVYLVRNYCYLRSKRALCKWNEMKWNESGFRPPLCTYRLNWARRTSWGWWDDWDDTVLQTQDSKFEPWRSEAEHATSRSRRLPTILTFTRGWGRNIFCFFQTAETGNRIPNSGVKGSGANHYPRAPARALCKRKMRVQSWASIAEAGSVPHRRRRLSRIALNCRDVAVFRRLSR